MECNVGVQSLREAQKVFFGASKEVIVELRPKADGRHLLRGLVDDRTPKRIPE